ncbi:GNAT family N-acetyltransferase [Sphingomonas desiccabilis]|uniref:N-acetyltransferase n=1 Tax=Sphingomonas desiccabilis TaxID=429134 RepID=A0A4Q2ITI0_9SPHN|nr:GNAT family N-acetyltransferase [Sphingomonas desiccabilis]MBB3911575.1 RimJ/RimL family protein N-acetyltransferase [Sphingomonas desiccabilis]RXZ31678.1 N-acetyltransferase [Sphingomonas desiccabilis]
MFARTERLTLRPGWAEDAPQLARAAGHEAVARNTSRMPWPYALGDAEAFLRTPQAPRTPALLVFAHEGDDIRLVGGAGLHRGDEGGHELGYWITPDAWGRGYATEAARALLAIADTLGIPEVSARHFLDNPASGRVLRKLDFRPTGEQALAHCRARGSDLPAVHYTRRRAGSPALPDRFDAPPLAA